MVKICCDICGGEVNDYNPLLEPIRHFSRTIELHEDGKNVDLCSTCEKSLLEWVQARREEVKNVDRNQTGNQ